ncbi:MAG: hypothetical protein IPG55_05095 [Saprospiraceae bacterium]|nr:hypothetical protein [Candidatus Defluviibacterium haderslevense]
MLNIFKTIKEARDFLDGEMNNSIQVEPEIIYTISDDIVSQQHFSFFNFELNGKYNASILETQSGFKVEILFKQYSKLVQAAKEGDFIVFKSEVLKKPSQGALSLAFFMAIQCERLNILHFYYTNDFVKSLKLFTHPLLIASRNDKINSFKFFLDKGMQLPNEILGPIFHDNSKLIMSHIIENSLLSAEILNEKYQTEWAKNGLLKKENEATRLFKNLINGG